MKNTFPRAWTIFFSPCSIENVNKNSIYFYWDAISRTSGNRARRGRCCGLFRLFCRHCRPLCLFWHRGFDAPVIVRVVVVSINVLWVLKQPVRIHEKRKKWHFQNYFIIGKGAKAGYTITCADSCNDKKIYVILILRLLPRKIDYIHDQWFNIFLNKYYKEVKIILTLAMAYSDPCACCSNL